MTSKSGGKIQVSLKLLAKSADLAEASFLVPTTLKTVLLRRGDDSIGDWINVDPGTMVDVRIDGQLAETLGITDGGMTKIGGKKNKV